MKKRLFRIISIAMCAVLLTFAVSALASDFGGFSGDSDYSFDSGSSWSSDWDSDYESDYGGGGFFPIFIGGGTSDGYSSEMSCSGGDMLMVLIFVLIVLLVIWYINKNRQVPVTTTVQRTDDSALMPMDSYVANLDPQFSVVDMQKKLANLYVQMQDGWSAKDISSLRPYLTDELYEQSDRQLDDLRKARQTPHVERVSVLGSNLRGFFQKDGMDHIIAEMSTRINTYVTDDNTGAIVRGDQNTEKFMTYEWDLVRPTGTLTGSEPPMQAINCPNCGAPVSINKTAKCPYCDTVITVKANDWVLASIKGLSQRSN